MAATLRGDTSRTVAAESLYLATDWYHLHMFSIPLRLIHLSMTNLACIRLNWKFTMPLSLTVNPVNCICPLLSGHKHLPCRNWFHIYHWHRCTCYPLWRHLFQPNTDFLSGNRGSTVVGKSWQKENTQRRGLHKFWSHSNNKWAGCWIK